MDRATIFSACFTRFRSSVIENRAGAEGQITAFWLLCQRTLSPSEWRVFRLAYLLGADRALCQKHLNIPGPQFVRACNRIAAKLGRTFQQRPTSVAA